METHQNLIIGTWNINGYKSKMFGNKTENIDFISKVKKLDIIGLTETHLGKKDQLSIPGFSPPSTLKRGISKNSSKSSCGIAVFVKDYLMDSKAVCRISSDSKKCIWLKLKKEHLKL